MQVLPELLGICADRSGGWFPAEHWSACASAIHEAARTESMSSLADTQRLEMIGNVFYRGRGAYLVGRACNQRSSAADRAVSAPREHAWDRFRCGANWRSRSRDSCFPSRALTSALMSHVRTNSCAISAQLMPRKRLIDLYNAIGYHRHGKTEFYRDFIRHLRETQRPLRRGGRRARDGHARLHAPGLRRRF